MLFLVSYPIVHFIEGGSVASFVVIYGVIFVLPSLWSWNLLNKSAKGQPKISKELRIEDLKGDKSYVVATIEQLVHKKRWRVRNEESGDRFLRFDIDTPVSIRSFGESIRIKADFISAHQFNLIIRSQPKLSQTIVDYGKNRDNISCVKAFFNQALAAR